MDEGAAVVNESGITPTEFKVLVLMDEEPDISKGGILLPIEYRDQHQMAGRIGLLVDVADEAFSWMMDDTRRPRPGDRVSYAKYAGAILQGKDGRKYRVMNDKDIACIVDEEVTCPR